MEVSWSSWHAWVEPTEFGIQLWSWLVSPKPWLPHFQPPQSFLSFHAPLCFFLLITCSQPSNPIKRHDNSSKIQVFSLRLPVLSFLYSLVAPFWLLELGNEKCTKNQKEITAFFRFYKDGREETFLDEAIFIAALSWSAALLLPLTALPNAAVSVSQLEPLSLMWLIWGWKSC